MTEYEQDFLLCSAAGFGPSDLFFSSGPDYIAEPYTSVMVGSIIEYQTTAIAATISHLPHTVPVREGQHESVWRWQQEDRHIEISVDGDNTTEEGVWLASTLNVKCTFSDLVKWGSPQARLHL